MRVSSSLLALSTLLLQSAVAQDAAERAALSLFWDYGRSPPVYPSPQGAGTGDWASAYSQARAIVAQMTNLEKQNVTIGFAATEHPCSGNSPGVDRLGYPGMCLQDAGNGVRGTEGVSGFPAGIHLGASWNKKLAFDRASAMGAEFKAKGVNAALGPVVGPLGRVALGGRNWEGASNDPYLAGVLGAATVQGLQQHVVATTKHFIVNEQETNRQSGQAFAEFGISLGYNQSVSSNVDDKTMHELYLWPFQDAVRAGTGSVMCSYNRINDSYGCANSKTLNGLLKTELGFQGFVMSDWLAQHTGVASADAGLDMAMPDSPFWQNLTTAVANGTLAQSRLDDMATRIIATYIKLGSQITQEGVGFPLNLTAAHQWVNARTPASAPTIMQGAIEGHVLVKNTNNALPLRAGAKLISLFGYDGAASRKNNVADPGWNLGYESTDVGANGTNIALGVLPPPVIAVNGTMWVGGGSGANTPPFVYDPFQAFTHQTSLDNSYLLWDFVSQYPTVDPASDVCVVFINAFSSEGGDRVALSDEYSDNLVNGIANQCANTMVVIHNAGIRIVDGFYAHPNVTAIIYAHLPGQMVGPPLVSLMYGEQSFSGRMPYTTAKNATDYGTLLYPTKPDNTSEGFTQSNFTEGVYIDYRAFEANNITARFPFGFGLTYTTFTYSSLTTGLTNPAGNLTALPAAAPFESGGNPRLFDIIANVTAIVTNSGNATAAEVSQLYIGIPNAPAKQLRGFSKDTIVPGGSTLVIFPLTRRDLSVWDVEAQQWRLQSGSYQVYVGKSVEDIQLTATIAIETN